MRAHKQLAPVAPLHASLALTPSPTPLSIPSSILSATYRSLRPLFQPVRSRISFYSSTDYLSPSNWSIIPSSSIPLADSSASSSSSTSSNNTTAAAAVENDQDLPHLLPSTHIALTLRPGDLILHHPRLPIQSPAQAFLPLNMLPSGSANATYIQAQRTAFEQGVPPPAEYQQTGGRAVRLEKAGGREDVAGWRGKKVMGY